MKSASPLPKRQAKIHPYRWPYRQFPCYSWNLWYCEWRGHCQRGHWSHPKHFRISAALLTPLSPSWIPSLFWPSPEICWICLATPCLASRHGLSHCGSHGSVQIKFAPWFSSGIAWFCTQLASPGWAPAFSSACSEHFPCWCPSSPKATICTPAEDQGSSF